MSLLSADADLYLRRGAKPDRSSFDCAPLAGSTLPELCRVAVPTPGRWWIGVNNFSAGTVAYALKASWQTVDVATDFHTVTPCRLLDSRDGQPLSSGVVRTLQAAGACQIPATARALSANVTVVGPTGNGRLVLYPADEGAPLSSTINFQSGQTRGNNALLKLDGAGALSALATVLGDGSVHVVVDVNGYFAEP